MDIAYSPINNSNIIQRIINPKKNLKKLVGKRNIKIENTSDIKILRKFTGYIY